MSHTTNPERCPLVSHPDTAGKADIRPLPLEIVLPITTPTKSLSDEFVMGAPVNGYPTESPYLSNQ